MDIDISVVIPVYNCQDSIERCVNSLLAQTTKKIEIILVNDGSTDNSKSICESICEKNQNVFLLNQDNQGAAKARDTGIVFSHGKYIGFLDSDDWVHPSMYEKMLDIANTQNAGIVQCGFIKTSQVDDKSISITKDCSVYTVTGYHALNQLLRVVKEDNFNYLLWNKIFRKELFLKFEMPVKKKANNDVPVIPRAFYYAERITYTEQPFVYYYIHNDCEQKSMSDDLWKSNTNAIFSHLESFWNITCFFEKCNREFYLKSMCLLGVWLGSAIRCKNMSEQQKDILREVISKGKFVFNKYVPLKYKLAFLVCKILRKIRFVI